MPSVPPRPQRMAPRRGQSCYGRRWSKLRALVLRDARGQCADCGRGAEEVHHIVPINKGGKPYDVTNLLPLCRACHNDRHGGASRRS